MDPSVPANNSKTQDVFQDTIVQAFVIGISSEALKAVILIPTPPYHTHTGKHTHTHTGSLRINSKEVPGSLMFEPLL